MQGYLIYTDSCAQELLFGWPTDAWSLAQLSQRARRRAGRAWARRNPPGDPPAPAQRRLQAQARRTDTLFIWVSQVISSSWPLAIVPQRSPRRHEIPDTRGCGCKQGCASCGISKAPLPAAAGRAIGRAGLAEPRGHCWRAGCAHFLCNGSCAAHRQACGSFAVIQPTWMGSCMSGAGKRAWPMCKGLLLYPSVCMACIGAAIGMMPYVCRTAWVLSA